MHPSVLLFGALLILAQHAQALVDVAVDRPYSLSPDGFTELVFRSHNNQGYTHAPLYNGTPGLLTLSAPVSSPPLMWTNSSADFNVTVTVALAVPTVVKEVMIKGPCCNMGIYTPIAAYAYGSASENGPWTFLGESTGLVSGDDVETPAERYELHFECYPDAEAWSYIQLAVTGAAGKYMSIRSVSIYA